ncbi:MAG: hypothetical protein LC792_21090 [Actinobacteria bacterium]|nr:hypothetical protein [Actinomycetota bacterium]
MARSPFVPLVERPLGPPPLGDLDWSLAEIRQLHSFLDGSIMSSLVRHHLWRSWGFCPRHTWAFGACDVDIRSTQPFSVGILYEDLTGRAAQLLGARRPAGWLLRRLRSQGSCYTCDYLQIARGISFENYVIDLHARANRRQRTVRQLAESRPIWEPRTCPVCFGGTGPPCRPHLLAGKAHPDRAVADYLAALTGRVRAMTKSFTWRGPKATPEERAAWVEALGWFGGWEYPFRALTEATGA